MESLGDIYKNIKIQKEKNPDKLREMVQVSSLSDSFDLEFFDVKPLPTAITLLSFLFMVEASEYFSYARYPVLIPSTPIFLYKSGFLFPWVIGSPPVRSQVNVVSL